MYRHLLKEYWGYDDFRGIQKDIIESIGNNQDTLGLMPTGGGKSITFQIPALAKEGVCIVITPLIALMKDQVQHLREKGILATAIYSGMSHREILTTLDNCIYGDYKLLYVSPERLSTSLFQSKVYYMNVSFITVDEAHCISQWGYDFRPSYLTIAEIRKIKPEAPILALTATATQEVIEDIQDKLGFRKRNVFRMSFERRNLTYVVRETGDKDHELIHILNSVPGTSIVYTRSRKGTRETAKMLNSNGIDATFYHAGLENAVRDQRQKQWQRGEVRVMVATNAFGMGIDKADVRTVIHMECPDSIEAYFQEAGRAGRDGKRSWSVILHNNHDDRKLKRRIADTFPEKDFVKTVYNKLSYYYEIGIGYGAYMTFPFNLEKFSHIYRMFPTLVDSALHILDSAGYIAYETDPDSKSRIKFILERYELDMLNNLTPNEEKVITLLLRLYGGIFIDYVYIELAHIAILAGLNENTVYLILKSLSKNHILHFIPQRKTPYITFVQDRVDPKELYITRDVYDDRKKMMETQVGTVINYIKNDGECRSVQLMRYFGEKDAKPCGCCDVCVGKNGNPKPEKVKNAVSTILNMLSDGKPHPLSELNSIRLPRTEVEKAVRKLIDDEKMIVEGISIRINK